MYTYAKPQAGMFQDLSGGLIDQDGLGLTITWDETGSLVHMLTGEEIILPACGEEVFTDAKTMVTMVQSLYLDTIFGLSNFLLKST